MLCKRFIPTIDREPLPQSLEGIRTRVCSGWIELCGKQEQTFHRPLLPGAGFAAGNDAKMPFDVVEAEYVPPVLSTLGGYYVVKDVLYGVTCAHSIKMNCSGGIRLHPKGTPVFQPSSMGLVVAAASRVPGLLDAYDTLKASEGHHGAMKLMIRHIKDCQPDFTTALPSDSECGVVHGGVLGKLDNDGPVVDVALMKLHNADVQLFCASSLKFPDLKSPPMILYDAKCSNTQAATNILHLHDFPRKIFSVFGRGARSFGTMRALVNPFQSCMYFRPVQPDGDGGLVFECIHAETNSNWKTGDSGTWCWTETGSIVGMGMAHAHIDGKHYCCILPMSLVIAAIEQLTNTEED